MKSSAAHLRVNGSRDGERGNIKILREYEKPDIDTEIERALSPYVLKGKKEAK